MKKIMMTLVAMLTIAASGKAMSYEQARNEALFLTDKMAYELNLTDEQYEAAYEINLDYLMGVTSYDDVFGVYWERRNLDLSYVLIDWQWELFRAATYFYRPLYWEGGYWHFGIYARYPHRDYFYFGRPVFYASYRGGHAWHRHGGHGYYYGHRDHYRTHTSACSTAGTVATIAITTTTDAATWDTIATGAIATARHVPPFTIVVTTTAEALTEAIATITAQRATPVRQQAHVLQETLVLQEAPVRQRQRDMHCLIALRHLHVPNAPRRFHVLIAPRCLHVPNAPHLRVPQCRQTVRAAAVVQAHSATAEAAATAQAHSAEVVVEAATAQAHSAVAEVVAATAAEATVAEAAVLEADARSADIVKTRTSQFIIRTTSRIVHWA